MKSGYLQYNKWNVVFSLLIYIAGFRTITYFAERFKSYNPPIPYSIRLLSFAYTANMWISAILGMPVLKLYQFKLGLFNSFMADDRFIELYYGVALGVIYILVIPRITNKIKPLVLAIITCFGIAFALFSYHKGWLIYHNWNHVLTVFRYMVPSTLILLYDHWELSYRTRLGYRQESGR